MSDTTICPRCEMENAYFDGLTYTCPDCDYEWSDDIIDEIITTNDSVYEHLINYEKPFFKLTHGKLYDCMVEIEHGVEEISFIPLAFENDRNRLFILLDARQILKKDSKFVSSIIKMDFDYIWNDGAMSIGSSDYDALTILCTTQEDGTLLDNSGALLFDFKKTNEI